MPNRARAMVIGGALGLLVAVSAKAQHFIPYQGSPDSGPSQEVIVHPPSYYYENQGPGRLGGRVITARMSRAIRVDDLDLRTEWGVRTLRGRVAFAASTLCDQLNRMYPIAYDNSTDQWPRNHQCYRDALEGGMAQADRAIRAARGYDSGY